MRFSLACEYKLGRRLIAAYLRQPYDWFSGQNSADLGKNILSEVSTVVHQVLIPLLILVSQSIICVALCILLIFVDPIVALFSVFALSFAYLAIFAAFKGFLTIVGRERLDANTKRYSAVMECFQAIKEVKVLSLESTYVSKYNQPAKAYAGFVAASQTIAQLPRYFVEAVAFGGLIFFVLFSIGRSGFSESLPLISLYAFCGYKLMPAVQQIYNASSQIRFAEPSLAAVYDDFHDVEQKQSTYIEDGKVNFPSDAIKLNNVSYRYPRSNSLALSDISLSIFVGKSTALVGPTGSGKTTALDLILTLLKPESGSLHLDNFELGGRTSSNWLSHIGYVPQRVFLTDDTIAANIAFGESPDEFDYEKIRRVADVAMLTDFVDSELVKGFETVIGERGDRLSGGQIQRIGIARALYRQPKLLVLDEATNALDSITEAKVMSNVLSYNRSLTTLIVAHRLTTVEACDQIYLLQNGRVRNSGSYKHLLRTDPLFEKMVKQESN